MFYKMINQARDRWYASSECTVNSLIEYMLQRGQMRDAQIEAIKTYLYLKIGCGNAPLPQLFTRGIFNSMDLDAQLVSSPVRQYLQAHPDAAALLEYASMQNDASEQVSKKLADLLKTTPESVDCKNFFSKAFYGVSYTDYLFSLPMGAGKTYLMAAFIYLDLYFAQSEPHNPAFAHNFIIFAPSGLKSSVVPSLKTIQKFDPSWIIPEPAATEIKRKLIFEVLDQSKTASKSNKTKNPNVQKIANHQPLNELFGLVAVTNAEKVILDRIQENNGMVNFLDEEDDRQANELRNLIGKLPGLSVFIDEVHHAVSDEIKLRAVVNRWMSQGTVNSVVGFSGTPYLEKPEKIKVTDKLTVANSEISNVVYYYPLISGVGNFLKKPAVKISDVAGSAQIIDAGVREFLDTYRDTVYENGLTAKLGIYCGTIEKCEELVYPLVSGILAEYGLPSSAILKFHKGNKQYPQPADSQMHFDTLDSSISPIRIVLLVQIGKEGWDCRSLTGIILSQEGDCPKNMVLQTSCRCLRQVIKGTPETALVYLNSGNAEKLNAQLMQQQHISLKEFASADNNPIEIKRYNRTAYLKLPKIDFYQLRIRFDTVVAEQTTDTAAEIEKMSTVAKRENIIKTTDLSMETIETEVVAVETGTEQATFATWLYGVAKGSFGFITMADLNKHTEVLQAVFRRITYKKDGIRYYSSLFDRKMVESSIRKAFYEKRDFTTLEELIPEEASLLNIANFTPVVNADKPKTYYPAQKDVENIIKADSGKLKLSAADQKMLELAESAGYTEIINQIKSKALAHPRKDQSFHYLPYHTDSDFEQTFLKEVLTLAEVESLGLEVYYNGDRALTEFKIKCYKRSGNKWIYIGMYTPDFLILQRREGKIYKAIIVETKGEIYANDPKFKEKRGFMETEFVRQNNAQFGYDRFEYLYLEDTLAEDVRIKLTHQKICAFFKEDK